MNRNHLSHLTALRGGMIFSWASRASMAILATLAITAIALGTARKALIDTRIAGAGDASLRGIAVTVTALALVGASILLVGAGPALAAALTLLLGGGGARLRPGIAAEDGCFLLGRAIGETHPFHPDHGLGRGCDHPVSVAMVAEEKLLSAEHFGLICESMHRPE